MVCYWTEREGRLQLPSSAEVWKPLSWSNRTNRLNSQLLLSPRRISVENDELLFQVRYRLAPDDARSIYSFLRRAVLDKDSITTCSFTLQTFKWLTNQLKFLSFKLAFL